MSTSPSRLRSSGAKPMPCAMAALGECRSSSLPSTLTRARGLGQLPEDDLGQLAAAGPDQPGEAHDLAGVDLEGDAAVPVAADVVDLQDDAVGGRRTSVEDLAQVATDHVAHDLVLGQAGRLAHRDQAAVAQDGHAVGQAQDLVESMAHVDDGHALRAQPAHEGEEALDLLVGQRRGGLVEGQDAHA